MPRPPAPTAASPLAWHAHPVALVAVAALAGGYLLAIRRLGPNHANGPAASRRQVASYSCGIATLVVALGWPMADLAQRWLLTAHLVQQVLVALVAAPLLLGGLPRWLVELLTRPAGVDAVVGFLTKPAPATAIFNASLLGLEVPPLVNAEASSNFLTGMVLVAALVSGLIMWVPVLRTLPGTKQLTAPGRMAYLLVQSFVPNVPATILLFVHRPLYSSFVHHSAVLGMSAMVDQQLAGGLAKLLAVGILWGAAGVVLWRASLAEDAGTDPDPLTWSDVQRELDRLERRHDHKGRSDTH